MPSTLRGFAADIYGPLDVRRVLSHAEKLSIDLAAPPPVRGGKIPAA